MVFDWQVHDSDRKALLMVTVWETTVNCVECSQEFFASREGENGRCMDCCACWTCDVASGDYTLAIDGRFCSIRCEEGFPLRAGILGMKRLRRHISRSARVAIFERDSWLCHLCLLEIDREEKWPSPDSATVDHVIAWSKGGSDDSDNLRAAHAMCNMRRKDKELANYLASIS